MAKKVTVKRFSAIEDGSTDWDAIRKNLSDIQDVANSHADEIAALAEHQTMTIAKMIEKRGKYVLAESGKHLRLKLKDAFCVLHDNIDQHIEIDIPGLTQPVKFNGTEKKGSGKAFVILPRKEVHFKDRIFAVLSENRRVSIYLTFESVEEEGS